MSLNNSGTREETQLPGAFPTEDQVLRDTASNITEAPTPFQTGERDLAQDARNLASGAVTTAAALGLAAKDAAIAAKDAAVPAAVAAKDAALPVANAASEKVSAAAGYPTSSNTHASHNIDETTTGVPHEVRDSIIKSGRSPEAAADIQAVHDKSRVEDELMAAVRGEHSAQAVTGVPTEVKNSIRMSGRAPEAAADRQAVQDKSIMEDELLGSVRAAPPVPTHSSHFSDHHADRGAHAPGASSGLDNAANRPHLYTQDTGSYQGSGTAVVLGTDTDRSFPLGARPEPQSTASATNTSVPDFSEPPVVTTGLETRPTTELSEPTGHDADYSHGSGAGTFAQNESVPRSSYGAPVQDETPFHEHQQSTSSGVPQTSRGEAPVQDKIPVRETLESTTGNGAGSYQTLSSGTPSGVRF